MTDPWLGPMPSSPPPMVYPCNDPEPAPPRPPRRVERAEFAWSAFLGLVVFALVVLVVVLLVQLNSMPGPTVVTVSCPDGVEHVLIGSGTVTC